MSSSLPCDQVLLMYGGGIDSYAMLLSVLQAGTVPTLCYVRMGHKAQDAEIDRMKRTAERHGIDRLAFIDCDVLALTKHSLFAGTIATADQHALDFVPNRNLMLAALGAVYAASVGIPLIAFAFNAGFSFSDANASFVFALNSVMKVTQSPTRFSMPLAAVGQDRIAQMVYDDLGSLDEFNRHVWSCYQAPDEHDNPCGVCTHCHRNTTLYNQLST
jgi:7-cyano-7-deazaguanine synthase in queuosine biosynthesis